MTMIDHDICSNFSSDTTLHCLNTGPSAGWLDWGGATVGKLAEDNGVLCSLEYVVWCGVPGLGESEHNDSIVSQLTLPLSSLY